MLGIVIAVALGSVSYEPAETIENAQAFLKAAMETAHDGNPRSQPRVVNRPCVSEIHDDYFFRGRPTIINWRRVTNVWRGSDGRIYIRQLGNNYDNGGYPFSSENMYTRVLYAIEFIKHSCDPTNGFSF